MPLIAWSLTGLMIRRQNFQQPQFVPTFRVSSHFDKKPFEIPRAKQKWHVFVMPEVSGIKNSQPQRNDNRGYLFKSRLAKATLGGGISNLSGPTHLTKQL